MKKFKRFLKITTIISCLIFAGSIFLAITYYHVVTHKTHLDTNAIESSRITSLEIYDTELNRIVPSSQNYIKIENLKPETINAFICAEDKRFYSHKGIDYIRVGGALVSNIKSKSFSEGASTITQQLIKNTLLSNEKTINRKLKEFKLARALEKQYNKNEILELYLNNIYFGSGAYGIENAANYYFGKSASNLTLSESALLAGTINAPSYYSIENNPEKSIARRNLILELMHNQNKINDDELISAKSEPLNLNITKSKNNNYIFNQIINEACEILQKTENELKNSGLKIYTNYNQNLGKTIDEKISKNYPELKNHNIYGIVIENKTNSVINCFGTAKNLDKKQQPGSVIKPILVYAPAIENNTISPATKILDEEINISGYSPKNADGKYHGFTSVRECIKKSFNVPAVKLLNEIGIENAQNFAKNLNIQFSNNDNNLAIALGGFTEGITAKQIADAYAAFANEGNFSQSSYILKITKNNKQIYSKINSSKQVMKDSTAYLITNMLIDVSKDGTAKKLSDLNFEVASKTGTVGKENTNKNSNAYCVSYTKNHTIITCISGELNESINGSTYPTIINKEILKSLYKTKKPDNFNKPDSVLTKNINEENYKENKITQTNNDSNLKENFSSENLPNFDNSINLKLEAFNFENRKPILSFFASNNFTYNIKRVHEKKEETLSSFSPSENHKIIKFEDISAKSNEIYEYFVEICEKSTTKSNKTNIVKLKSF